VVAAAAVVRLEQETALLVVPGVALQVEQEAAARELLVKVLQERLALELVLVEPLAVAGALELLDQQEPQRQHLTVVLVVLVHLHQLQVPL
jgi:hypothetical protein